MKYTYREASWDWWAYFEKPEPKPGERLVSVSFSEGKSRPPSFLYVFEKAIPFISRIMKKSDKWKGIV
jgi:hypothetical protein